ncbi:vacuolar protein sorting-associated protein 41 homolog [Frankliniella occidentalis]|uniref:Vacuolar protein sorting-associated protein 41 homolog n=1 Tax=Frankliniella occidentalis TaxID=133901 RepID=A0A6J1T3L3_FRAOC|nr:vacuolar protein sorting-associated protein 41 homolog [Frankliniella occidentalis]XP_026285246.1 vacuolar protein sorting-associated protein 41 homolog [Frankliniella occidentalis]
MSSRGDTNDMANNTANESKTDESGEDSDDSEESEPKLKYIRMKNSLDNIFLKYAAKCISVHPKFVCLGNNWGMVHLLDHLGNTVLEELRLHSTDVNQISIDSNGDFIASCSDDGRVFIQGLYSSDNNQELRKENCKVKSVAIDPNYYKPGSGRRFITGDEQLVLYEKTFLTRLKSTVLCKAQGLVHNIKWNGPFVAWADNLGVWVFDIEARRSLGLIKWPRNPEALPENYRCNICWKDSSTFLVGWVDCVRICHIRKKTPHEIAIDRDKPDFIVDLVSAFETDFYISGIGPLDEQLVILGYAKEPDEDGKAQRPVMYVVQPEANSFVELRYDSLSLRGYQHLKCNEYHLESLIEENNFFIVSPKDVVVASPYDTDDRVQWLMEHSKFETAMEVVAQTEARQTRRYTFFQVGQAYLNHLLEQREFQQAGELCQKILGTEKRLWESEVFKFARIHQLRAVSPYLPRGDYRLDSTIYEMVLYEFLKLDAKGFLDVLKEWSPDLYNVKAVTAALCEHCVQNEADTILLEALAILYSHDKQYDKALAVYLKLKNTDLFQLIRKHNLYGVIHDMIEDLVKLDEEQAIALFLEKGDDTPDMKRFQNTSVPAAPKLDKHLKKYLVDPGVVVAKLEKNPKYQYKYLDALDRRDAKGAGQKYHGLLVKLYADYARDKLLPLLHRSGHYPIQEALNICKERNYYSETVYLLGRIGNFKEALNLIMKELGDIDQAINFCKEHHDIELWEDLISYSLSKADFITFLLQRIGTYVDPRILVQRIECGMEIPGLKNSLVKLMRDYSLQVSVQEGCRKILSSDNFNLHDRLVKMQQRGIMVDDDQVCGKCNRSIIVKDASRASNVVVFFCKHSFHGECAAEYCIICNAHKTKSPF